MSNLNTVDDLPNITSNFSDDVYQHDETPYERIFLEIFTILGLISVAANCLLIFVILKYKKMREDATNVIFLQVNILEAIYFIATPLSLRVAMAFFDASPVHAIVFCVSYQVEFTLMIAITWFMFLLVCDWYLKLYYKNAYVKFCRVYKFFVVALYVLIIFVSSINIQLCFKHYLFAITYLIMLACVVLIVLFLIVINVIHLVRRKRITTNHCKGNIGLAIANICFVLWSPSLLFFVISVAGVFIHSPALVIFLVTLGFSSPVFNLMYLYFYDDRCNVFLKKVFTCKCNDYVNEDLEGTAVSYNDVNGVQIPEN